MSSSRFDGTPRAASAVVLSLQLVATGVAAQSLAPVVVTATRSPRALNETLSDVTVIDAKAIADAPGATVPELLQTLGGVEMSQNGGSGKVSGLFLRGTKTAQTAIVVDGIRLENPLGGGGNLELLPLSMIDRIEILRGPASALYGSGAIGGVIQIFTRAGGGQPAPFASLAYGTQGTSQARAGVTGSAGPDERTRYALSVSDDRSGGYEATTPSSPFYQADRDGYRQWHASGSLTQRLSADWSAGLSVAHSAGRSRYDDTFSTPETAVMNYEVRTAAVWLQGHPTEAWRTTLRVGDTTLAYRFDAFVFAPNLVTRTLSWQNTLKLPVGQLLAGYDQTGQSIDGEGLTTGAFAYLRNSRVTRSPFAGYEAAYGAHLFRVHVRHDAIDAVGSQTSGSAAYGYRIAPAWLVRAAFGTGFRAPTFDDLYNPFGSNAALRPERSRGYEAALERHADDGVLKVTAFASRIRDAIELDANFTPQNLDSARVRGVTLEARRDFGALTVGGQMTVQRAEGEHFDATTGEVITERLVRRARRYGVLHAQWRQGPWRAAVQWVLQGDRIDASGARMPGYGVLNLTAAYAIDRQWELFARAGNIGDVRYQTAYGYNGAPFTLLAGVRWSAR
jgi:vitamin B12 transporter